MLHVFHIDAGRMLTFDVGYAAESVSTLQEALSLTIHAPVSEQVLLISGGEILDKPERKVSRYSAGTDSNPIFLVCLLSNENTALNNPDTTSQSGLPDLMNTSELEHQIQHVSQSSPSLQTVQFCAQTARRLVQSADTNVDRCAQLVYDQHLLHQGWLAVIANLDDTVSAFRQRLAKFRDKIERFAAQRQRAVDLLAAFENDAQLLKKIPLLPCLLSPGDIPQSQSAILSNSSLFDWISSKEPEHSLHGLAADARQALDKLLEPKILENLMTLEGATLDRAQDMSMKEIGGLGKRLSRLDEYLQHVKKLQNEQRQYAESLRAQEQRAAAVNDQSIFGDLCMNQISILKKMLERQRQMTDITRRFYEAKTELLNNIHQRLRWVKDTHQLIQTGDSKVMLNGERLHRLRRQLELLKQLHDAPFVYASAVTEVVRRKAFSREFLEWADRLTDKSRHLYADENKLRSIFSEKFDRHFLRSLFPGLEDRLPEFAQETPEPFDINLPPVEVDHVRQLRSTVPQLQHLLYVQKPNVYERVSFTAPGLDEKAKQMASSALRREASFFSQTPPKYATAVPVSGSAPVIIHSRVASCQSPSWFAGDEMEFFPNGQGAAAGDGLFSAPHQPAMIQGTQSDEMDDTRQNQAVSDSDSEVTTNHDHVRSTMGNGSSAARSAPIRIPIANWNIENMSTTPGTMTGGSRGQFVEKDGSSGKFGTPEEHMLDVMLRASREDGESRMPDMEKKTAVPDMTEIGTAQLSREKDVISRDLKEKSAQLILCLEKEQILRRQLVEKEHELERFRSFLNEKVLPEMIEVRQFFEQIKRTFEELTQTNATSTAGAIEILNATARRLESNLQTDLEEARKAEDEIRKTEFNTALKEFNCELEEEKKHARAIQRQLENSEAFLKQKDDVIELLQQRLQEQENNYMREMNEMKADLMKRLLIERELEVDALRVQYDREIEIKETEIQQLKQELSEKRQVLKDMRKEQDRLMASMYDRAINSDFAGTTSFSSSPTDQRNEEFEEKLRSTKSELEREYKDKLQMLTAGLEARHAQQLERVRKEKEIEIRMLRQQLEQCSITNEKSPSDGGDIGAVASTTFQAWRSAENADMVLNQSTSASTVALFQSTLDKEKESDECVVSEHEEDEHETPNAGTDDSNLDTTKHQTQSRHQAVQTKRVDNMKISVLRISKGDLVLLVFDPQFKAFVVFTVSSTLYILKNSCLQRLGLGDDASQANADESTSAAQQTETPGFPKQRWILGRVVELDYCEIKKPSNRYGLPLNTRFFRVSADAVALKTHT